MLDSKFIRANAEAVRQAIANKGVDASVDTFLQLDERRRLILAEVEQLKNQRNTASLQVAELKKAKQDATSLIAETRTIGQRIKELDEELRDVEARLQDELLSFPNIPHESVPIGPDESGNVFVRSFSEPTKFGFTPLPHWDLADRKSVV